MTERVQGWNGWGLLIGASLLAVAIGVAAFVLRASALVPLATVPYVLATVGSAIGASAFTRHDRMWWAWVAIAAGNAIGGLTCALTGRPPLKTPYGFAPVPPDVQTILIVKVLLLNTLTVAGLVILARAWRSMGARLPWYRLAMVVAFAIGAVVAGPSVVQGVQELVAGRLVGGLTTIVSSAGDLISITMIGPLTVAAIAMRGGGMAWPYTLLTMGTLAWLAYDANAALSGDAQMIADLVTASLGLVLTGAAGVAHRRVLQPPA